ncbi:hypothetical protein BVY04_04470 [bacterium M21]|nr:hypothetical protein BVY04_04470 [bacterium M21]
MRTARQKMVGRGYCYHLITRISGPKDELLFSDVDNEHYGRKKLALDPVSQPERCTAVAAQMIDISHLMAVFQKRFACYINRTHNRRGRLWSVRFKSTILQGLSAVWNCAKYVELNAVRAGGVENPADYRFYTWDRFNGSGTHAFELNFTKHMKQSWAYANTGGCMMLQ